MAIFNSYVSLPEDINFRHGNDRLLGGLGGWGGWGPWRHTWRILHMQQKRHGICLVKRLNHCSGDLGIWNFGVPLQTLVKLWWADALVLGWYLSPLDVYKWVWLNMGGLMFCLNLIVDSIVCLTILKCNFRQANWYVASLFRGPSAEKSIQVCSWKTTPHVGVSYKIEV